MDTDAKPRLTVDEAVIAVGLGIMLFLRPWFDGITFPEYNVTFAWGSACLAVFWAVLVWLGRMPVRHVWPPALLGAFVLVAALTSPFTVQFNATYRGLINWVGYLLLFCVAANGIRSRGAVALVLGFFIVTSIAEVLYAALHVNYIMPQTRAMIMKDPRMIPRFFPTDTLTPELSARLESNRASGSLLFANALACWVLTGIPLAIGAANALYLRLAQRAREPKPAPARGKELEARWRVLLSALAVAAAGYIVTTVYYTMFVVLAYGPTATPMDHPIRTIIYCFALPTAIAYGAYVIAEKRGPYDMFLACTLGVVALFGILMVYGLGATYSRGGILATAASLLALALLMFGHGRAGRAHASRIVAAALLIASPWMLLAESEAQAPAASADTQSASAPENQPQLRLEGVSPSLQALLDPNTAMLRFGYWISGVRMFLAHPFTGVGLGNFGTAYPMYQLIGAGDVKPAHNDYLQTAAETGIFGLIAFLTLWTAFVIGNFRSVWRETVRSERWFRAGLFASVLGFLFHSFVDFNFYNPSLAALVFVLAGLSYASMPPALLPAPNRKMLVLAAAPLVLWLFYAGYRVNHVDDVMGRELTRKVRLETAWMLLDPNARKDNKADFAMYDSTVALLIEDRSVRESLGKIFVPTRPGGTTGRYLRPGEAIPPTAMLIMPAQSMAAVRKAALDAIPMWIQRCIDADRVYPHDPEVSAHIIQWYDKLREYAPSLEEKKKASDEAIAWSRECIRRSPFQVAYHDVLGTTLWDRGDLESGRARFPYYDEALVSFKQCTEIYPIKPEVWRRYAERLVAYGDALADAGDYAAAQQWREDGRRAYEHAAELEKQIHERAMGRN